MTCRVLADKCVVELADKRAFSGSAGSRRFQCVAVCLRDELVRPVEIGKMMIVIGVPVFDSSRKVIMLEASNIIESAEIDSVTSGFEAEKIMRSLPPTPYTLYTDKMNSSGSLGLHLAYVFGAEITPAGTYFSVKLAMLLSLVAEPHEPIDILAVGRESSLLHRLLCYAASFSTRHIRHSVTGSHLTASLVTDRHSSASVFIEDESSYLSAFLARCLNRVPKPRVILPTTLVVQVQQLTRPECG